MEEKIDTITVADVSRDMGSFVSYSVWGVGGGVRVNDLPAESLPQGMGEGG